MTCKIYVYFFVNWCRTRMSSQALTRLWRAQRTVPPYGCCTILVFQKTQLLNQDRFAVESTLTMAQLPYYFRMICLAWRYYNSITFNSNITEFWLASVRFVSRFVRCQPNLLWRFLNVSNWPPIIPKISEDDPEKIAKLFTEHPSQYFRRFFK